MRSNDRKSRTDRVATTRPRQHEHPRSAVARAVESERGRLFDVLEALPAMTCLLTQDYHITFANRSFRDRYGECLGRRCFEQCYGLAEPCAFCENHAVLKTGQARRWEVPRPDGRVLETYTLPFAGADGSPMILEMSTDVTDRMRDQADLSRYREHLEALVRARTAHLDTTIAQLQTEMAQRLQAEAVLRERNEQLQRVTRASRIGLFEWNIARGSVFWSKEAHELTGFEPSALVDLEQWLGRLHPDDRARASRNAEEVLDLAHAGPGPGPRRSEYRVVRDDGSVRWLEFTVVFDVDAGSQVVRGAVRDISDTKAAGQKLAEQALLLANVGDAVIALDMDFRITYWGGAAERTYGYSADEAMGRSVVELLRPDYMDTTREDAIRRLMDSGETRVELVQRTKDGRRLNIESHAMLVRGDDGKPRGIVGINRDVTTRRQAENELRHSEERFRALAEALPQIVWTAAPDGSVEWLNRRWYDFTGVREDVGAGWSWMDVAHPDDTATVLRAWEQARQEAGLLQIEIRLRRHDGQYQWFLARAWPLRDAGGNVVRWFGTNTDIDELKAAEDAVRQSRQDLDRAQAVAAIGSWRLDLNQNVLKWSDENHRIFDVPVGTPLTYEAFLEIVHPEDRRYVDTQWQAGLRGEPYDIEHRIVVGPHVKWVREKAYLEFDEAGRLLAGFGITQDITERKRIEDALRLSEARLRERATELAKASRMKDEFLATMSHELRTPLGGVIGVADLLQRADLPAPQRELVRLLRSNATALYGLVGDILDYSRIEAGSMTLAPVPFSLETCVEDALDTVAQPALRKGLDVGYALDSEVPPVVVADQDRVRQVLINLLSNAVKFTDAGEVSVRVGARQVDDEHVAVTVRVCDTGCGIPGQQQHRLFRRFSQIPSPATGRPPGTGLGLAISERLSQLLGGSLSVDSAPGRGSTFTFVFAARVPPDGPADDPLAGSLAGLRALVFLGRGIVGDQIQALLRRLGAAYTLIGHPADAWPDLGAPAIDVVIVDAEAAGDRLDDVVVKCRAHPRLRHVPLVLVTRSISDDRERSAPAGWLVARPVRNRALYEALCAAAGRSVRVSVRPAGTPAGHVTAADSLAVLVVEDNDANRVVVKQMLEELGVRADEATSGVEAVARARARQYDVIFMDVQLPDFDGLEATRRIRAEQRGKAPRIIALTTHVIRDEETRCRDAGMDGYLSKPLRFERLETLLRSLPES